MSGILDRFQRNKQFLTEVFSVDSTNDGKAHFSDSTLTKVAAPIAGTILGALVTPFTDRFGATSYPSDDIFVPQTVPLPNAKFVTDIEDLGSVSENGIQRDFIKKSEPMTTQVVVTETKVPKATSRGKRSAKFATYGNGLVAGNIKGQGRVGSSRGSFQNTDASQWFEQNMQRQSWKYRGKPGAKSRKFRPGRSGKYGRGTISSGVSLGVAESIKPKGNQVAFSNGREPGSLRVKAKIFIGTLTYSTTGTTILSATGPGGTNTGGQWYLLPTDFVYMNLGVIPRMAQYFDNYYQHGQILEFNTQTNANSGPYTVTWCFCEAYDHWERVGVNTGVDTPTRDQILAMSNSRSFPSWSKSQKVYLGASKIKYSTAAPCGNNAAVDFGLSAAAYRQTIAGTAGMKVTGTFPTGSNVPIGDIFLHLDLEFVDMSGLMTVAPDLVSSNHRIHRANQEMKRRNALKEAELPLRLRGEGEKEIDTDRESKKNPTSKSLSDDFSHVSLDEDDHDEPGAPKYSKLYHEVMRDRPESRSSKKSSSTK